MSSANTFFLYFILHELIFSLLIEQTIVFKTIFTGNDGSEQLRNFLDLKKNISSKLPFMMIFFCGLL